MDDSIFTTVLVPVGLAIVMVSLGLSLVPADFKRVFVLPRGVLIGLANLLVISPFLAFGVAELYGLGAALAVGLVLLGASPGGTTANMFTHLARGDTALSITMTAISSVAAVITVPLFLKLGIDHFGADGFDSDVNMGGIVARVFLITLVPLAIGMTVRQRRADWVQRHGDRVRTISLAAFVMVVVAAVVAEFDKITDNFGDVAAAALTLNVLAMTLSFTIARVARLSDRQSTAIAMELGVHNATLAIAVATAVDNALIIPAAVYSMFMFLTAGLFARIMARRNSDEPVPVTPLAESEPRDDPAPEPSADPAPARSAQPAKTVARAPVAAPEAADEGIGPVWWLMTAIAVLTSVGALLFAALSIAGVDVL